MQTQMEIASSYLAAGLGVFPVVYRDKRPEVSTWKPYQSNLPSAGQVVNWFFGGFHNVGVVCGWQGLAVIDFDEAVEYGRWLRWCGRRGGQAAYAARRAYRVSTSRGMHVYVRLPDKIKTIKIRHANGDPRIDVKGQGGYVLGATSVHPSGTVYTALRQELLFPMVRTLSEVLPADLLAQTEAPADIKPPRPIIPASDDPWENADRATLVDSKASLKIKAKLRIESFFPKYAPSGDEYFMTQCPFHDDNRPSFWIDAKRQICGCFGACTPKALDVISFWARLHGVSDAEAIRFLARTI
jgi:hypothetical protein